MVGNLDAALSEDQIRWLVAYIKTITSSTFIHTGMGQVFDVSYHHASLQPAGSCMDARARARTHVQHTHTLHTHTHAHTHGRM